MFNKMFWPFNACFTSTAVEPANPSQTADSEETITFATMEDNLASISLISDDTKRQEAILTRLRSLDDAGNSALLRATSNNNPAAAVQTLTKYIELIPEGDLRQEIVKNMLIAQDPEGYNALMHVLWSEDPDIAAEALIRLVKLIPEGELRQATVTSMLIAQDWQGCNSLINAACNAVAINALIKLIELIPEGNLRQEVVKRMFEAKDYLGKNALEIATEFESLALPILRHLALAGHFAAEVAMTGGAGTTHALAFAVPAAGAASIVAESKVLSLG